MSGAIKRFSYNRLDSETSLQPPSATLKSPFVSGDTQYYGLRSPEEIQLVSVDSSRSPKYDNEDFSREDSPSPIPIRRARSWYRLPAGWRVGITLSAIAAFLSLIANLTLAVWSTTHRGDNSLGVLIEVFRGDCGKASRLNLWVHLAVNAISTILLSASNFTMQCVVAPTRDDIDRTHAKMKWLDIGVPSLRNIRHISTWRKTMWILLFLSSLPLHLMFNSVFFISIATYDYNVIFATPNFTTGADFSTANGRNTVYFQPPSFKENLTNVQHSVVQREWERLENVDCIRAYANDLITDRRHVVVVSSNASIRDTGSVIGSQNQEYVLPERWYTLAEGYNPYTWICSDRDLQVLHPPPHKTHDGYGPLCYSYAQRLTKVPDEWSPSEFRADYCLSEQVPGSCAANVNIAIIWIIVVCNIIKLVVMTYLASSKVLTQPLVTIGDAITSFVTKPDPTTIGMCLISRRDMSNYTDYINLQIHNNDLHPRPLPLKPWFPEEPQKWIPKDLRWSNAASKKRWTWAIVFYLACIITVLALLGKAIGSLTGDKSISALADLGLGHPNSQTMINGWAISTLKNKGAGVVLSVLVANSPQLILSLLYFSINSLCTSMTLAYEWSQFSVTSCEKRGHAKTLRTSLPTGQQRSSYFLQLPFRFAIPLITVSAILHWLVSQSIFLAVVTIYDEFGNLKQNFAVSTCGFSPIAMIYVVVVGVVLGIGTLVLGWMRLDSGMTVVGSCSAAISAASHAGGDALASRITKQERFDIIQGSLVWGEVSHHKSGETLVDGNNDFDPLNHGMRHCSFASAAEEGWRQRVKLPDADMVYE